MANSTGSLSTVLKIRSRVHYSWIAVFIFMTAAMITQFSTNYPFMERLALGLVASCLFLIIILLRMFIISLLAIKRGAVIKSDTLFAIGGVLEIEKNSTFLALEVLLATVGLLIYLFFGGILFTVYLVLANTGSIMVHILIQWLAFIFFMLSIFNILPGLPLDGGRIARVIIWKTTKDYDRATRIISWTGWGIGMGFTIAGIILTITTQQWFVGVLLALPGLILQNAATHQRRQISQQSDQQEQTETTEISNPSD